MGDRIRPAVLVGLSFLVTLVAANALVARVGPDLAPPSPWPTPTSQLKYDQVLTLSHDPEVLFLGSSFTEAAVDPERLLPEIDSYNLAMPFTSFGTMYVWLRDVVYPTMTPRLVVVGITQWTDPRNPGIDLEEAISNAISIEQTGRSTEPALLSTRGALAVMDRTLARRRLLDSDLWTAGGHLRAYYSGSGEPTEWSPQHAAILRPSDAAELRDIIDLTRESGSSILIFTEVSAPSIAPSSGDTDQLRSGLDEISTDTGVEVVIPPGSILPDPLFVDGIHPNEKGTSRFSVYLKSVLQQRLSGS